MKNSEGGKNLPCLPPLLASWLNSLVMYLKTHWAVNPNVSNNYYHSNTPLSVWTLDGKENQIFLSLSSLDIMGHCVRLHSGSLPTETEQLQTLIELSSYINIKQDCFPFQIFLFSCCAVQDHTHTHVNFSGFYDTNMLWDIAVFTSWWFGKGTKYPGEMSVLAYDNLSRSGRHSWKLTVIVLCAQRPNALVILIDCLFPPLPRQVSASKQCHFQMPSWM